MVTKIDPDEVIWAPREDIDLSFLSPEAQERLGQVRDSVLKANQELQGQNIVRIDWDISEGGELGSAGTRLYRQFGEVAADQKPGTIIQAEAADDGFGSKGISDAQKRQGGNEAAESNVRERLYQRSGLSEPNEAGQMYGIVKYRPDGRRVLEPLDFSRPIQEQVDEAAELWKTQQIPDFENADSRSIIRKGVMANPARERAWKRVEALSKWV